MERRADKKKCAEHLVADAESQQSEFGHFELRSDETRKEVIKIGVRFT